MQLTRDEMRAKLEEADGEEGLSEDDLKAILKGVVQSTLDIVSEKVFAAEYKKLFARVTVFHPASEFELLKKKKDFTSISWKATYDFQDRAG